MSRISKAARRCAQPGKTKKPLENFLKTTMILMETKPGLIKRRGAAASEVRLGTDNRAAVRGCFPVWVYIFKVDGPELSRQPVRGAENGEACGAKTVWACWKSAGHRVLTRALAQRASGVVSLELDGRLLPILSETLRDYDNVRVLCADAMEADLEEIVKTHFAGLEPSSAQIFRITSPPDSYALARITAAVSAVTVMVQREPPFACARPG